MEGEPVREPFRRNTTPRPRYTPEPQHGTVLGVYAVVFDGNIRQNIFIPVTRRDIVAIVRGFIRLP